MMMKEFKGIYLDSSLDINQALLRLSHFDPSNRDNYGNQIIDYLILDTLSNYGSLLKVAPLDIKKAIKQSFLLDFEEAEIVAAAKRLQTKSLIEYYIGNRTENALLQIIPQTEEKIKNNIRLTISLEENVLNKWREELRNKYKDYPIVTENIENLVHALQLFTSRMFVRHGVESVSLLYPEEEKTKKWLQEISGGIFKDLIKLDSFTDSIMRLEIPSFFKTLDAERKTYITNLFNSSFFWYLIQVDEKCSRLLSEVTKGQKLCLDNNILYSLVGLDGTNLMQSTRNLLKLARSLNYDLIVTTKTIEEFYASLDWHLKEYKKKPFLPAEFAKIATDNLGSNNFVTSYWEYFAKTKLSIEEFVSEKSQIAKILDKFEIKKVESYRKEIEASKELKDEESILRSTCETLFNNNIIEHDAFHRIFINKMRNTPKYNFSDSTAWFLTNDTKLPKYDRIAKKNSKQLPFCILTDEWIQINRPLLSRTSNQSEYEESFHLLVTQPYLRTTISSLSMEKAYSEVLGRLNRYKHMNPELALSIVADKHFMVTMASDMDEAKIEESMENKFVDLVSELGIQKKSLEDDAKTDKSTIEELQQKLNQVESLVREITEQDKSQIDTLNLRLNEETKQKRIKEQDLNRTELEKESAIGALYDKNMELSKYKKAIRVWLFTSLLFIGSSIFLWTNNYWLGWHFLDIHKNKVYVEMILQLIIIFSVLNIPYKRHWEFWCGSILTLILAVIALLAI